MLNFGSDSQFHHYLQVNGSPISEQNDFSAGDHRGVLRHRPSRYVPVKVPLYDEQGTVNDRIAVTQSDDPGLSARDVTSRFHWVYRPEFSFSVIDLELSAINLQGTQDGSQDNKGSAQKINILDDTTPVISSADDLVEVIFNLIGSEYQRITPFEGERHYIFALGEQEIDVRIDKGTGQEQQITFNNLKHLAQLNAEDYLTLSLYLNQDAQNVLWEWGFESSIYIEKTDPDYPDVTLPWDEYYPSLGKKDLVIRAARENNDMVGRIVKATITSDINNVGLLGSNDTSPAQTVEAAFVQEGPFIRAHIQLAGSASFPDSSLSRQAIDGISIQFELLDEQKQATGTKTQGTWYIRNNANTRIQEIIDGVAVYTFDTSDDAHHKSLSDHIDADTHADKRFDFVQALFNQVIPRKRSVNNYTYTDEDGIFGPGSQNRIQQFKQQFNINNTRNSASSAFNKLMKDYRLQSQQATWTNKILDQHIFIGSTLDTSTTPNRVDTEDTGLYELYINGVNPFVDAMIEEADRYAGNEVTVNWVARTGEGATEHGDGMSYCFGCKQTVEEFNNTVANCQAETRGQIQNRENDETQINYTGHVISDAQGNCIVSTSGGRRWAGLNSDEYNSSTGPFQPRYWSGIDCSGLVQRAVDGARGVASSLIISLNQNPGVNPMRARDILRVASNTSVEVGALFGHKKYLRKGDLVGHDLHIAIVISKANASGVYEIIHANGNDEYDDQDEDTPKIFSRKVLVTKNDAFRPSRYGRIKLWN